MFIKKITCYVKTYRYLLIFYDVINIIFFVEVIKSAQILVEKMSVYKSYLADRSSIRKIMAWNNR